MTQKFNKLKKYFYVWDGIWSVPVAVVGFILTGFLIQKFFGTEDGQGGPGFYDPSFIQAASYAALIMVAINFIVFLGIYFNFKVIFRYFVGCKDEKDPFKLKLDFENLTPWQRIKLSIGLYFLLSAVFLAVFKMLL